jgi:hypothetical protein
MPTVIFGPAESRQHGNLYPACYRNICANPEWAHRLAKVQTGSRSARPRAWQWRELDRANSSDALLMNILCCRRTLSGNGNLQNWLSPSVRHSAFMMANEEG